VGYSFRGKQWLEWGNPYAVGMIGLLGWGGAYKAMHNCDLCLLLGTDFPFTDFLPDKPKKVQVDRWASHLGRRTHVDLGLVGHVADRKGRNLFGSLGWASMANSMPNAMGAALAFPGRQVIALCGDGGFTMLLGDLLTIVERQLPAKLIVLNNGGLEFVNIEMEEA